MNFRFLLSICFFLSSSYSDKVDFCSNLSPVYILNSSEFTKNIGIFEKNNVTYIDNNYFDDDGKSLGCICNIKKCIRKCCGINTHMHLDGCRANYKNSTNFYLEFYSQTELKPNVALKDFLVITGLSCPLYYTGVLGESQFLYMQEDGRLYYNEWRSYYSMDKYCVDFLDNEISAILCEVVDNKKEDTARRVNGYCMIVSMPFLIATFLVYLILPEKNLHRRALMSYVLSVFGGYSCLVALEFSGVESSLESTTVPCHITGYLIIFFFMVSFLWLNVMCIDMWITFSSTINKNISELKKFIYSSIYAWGMSILFVLMVFLLNTYGDKDADYHPKIAVSRCFLEDGLASFYYFYLPMAIIVGINFILFILTSLKIFKIKKETKVLKRTDSKIHSNDEAKQKFNLYLKLMFAMGVNWSMEFISFITIWKWGKDPPTAMFYLPDITNALYGLIIFLIFVFKKKTWRSLIKRYYVLIGKSYLAPISSSRRSTRTSGYSTETVDSVDYHPCGSPTSEKPNDTSL